MTAIQQLVESRFARFRPRQDTLKELSGSEIVRSDLALSYNRIVLASPCYVLRTFLCIK